VPHLDCTLPSPDLAAVPGPSAPDLRRADAPPA